MNDGGPDRQGPERGGFDRNEGPRRGTRREALGQRRHSLHVLQVVVFGGKVGQNFGRVSWLGRCGPGPERRRRRRGRRAREHRRNKRHRSAPQQRSNEKKGRPLLRRPTTDLGWRQHHGENDRNSYVRRSVDDENRWGCIKFCGQAGTSSKSDESFGLYFQLLPVM
jgi:hypothetical protein